ncbi:MAG: hypothetical protein MJ101_01335 [Clostridia bacterium]|nr:hypothetical protein [Clostridia bacterium]
MRTKKCDISKSTGYIAAVAALFMAVYSLACPSLSYDFALKYLRLGAVRVLPSLIVYMVCARLIVRSGALAELCRRMTAAQRLLGVSPSGLTVVLIGLAFGFPMGAVAADELYDRGEIDREEARRIMPFCNNAGASFLIGAVGAGMFGSASVGVSLMIGQTLSSVTALILTRGRSAHTESASDISTSVSLSDISDSIAKSGTSAVSIITFIAFFGAASEMIARVFHLPEIVGAIIGGAFEISGGMAIASGLDLPLGLRLLICAVLCGFGGLSVMMQAAFAARDCGFDAGSYLIGRVIHGVGCCAFSTLIYYLTFEKILALSDFFYIIHLYIVTYPFVLPTMLSALLAIAVLTALNLCRKKRKKSEKRVEKRQQLVYNRSK